MSSNETAASYVESRDADSVCHSAQDTGAILSYPVTVLGVWRSLVARSVRVGEVPSSNLGTPIESRGNHRFPREELLDRTSAGVRPLDDQQVTTVGDHA